MGAVGHNARGSPGADLALHRPHGHQLVAGRGAAVPILRLEPGGCRALPTLLA